MKQNQYGRRPALLVKLKLSPVEVVSMRTGFGGTRIVDMLVGEQITTNMLDSLGSLRYSYRARHRF